MLALSCSFCACVLLDSNPGLRPHLHLFRSPARARLSEPRLERRIVGAPHRASASRRAPPTCRRLVPFSTLARHDTFSPPRFAERAVPSPRFRVALSDSIHGQRVGRRGFADSLQSSAFDGSRLEGLGAPSGLKSFARGGPHGGWLRIRTPAGPGDPS